MTDLPDYTRNITVNVDVPPTQNYFHSKAESVTKYVAHIAEGDDRKLDIDVQEAGKKIGILMIVAVTSAASENLTISVLEEGEMSSIVNNIRLVQDVPLILTFPCWEPDMDASEAEQVMVEISQEHVCNWTTDILCVYYEYDA